MPNSRRIRFILTGLMGLAGAGLAAAITLYLVLTLDPPPVPIFDAARGRVDTTETKILDRNGRVLHVMRHDFKKRRLSWTPLEDISPAVIRLVIHTEDRSFYSHAGVDYPAFVKSGVKYLSGMGRLRGASTITMQLAGKLEPALSPRRSGRSVKQKIEQMRYALALEDSWQKPQILEAYLNLVTFRSELVGIESASRALFKKRPWGLNNAEAALLAALVRNPNADPSSVKRRACVLYVAATENTGCTPLYALAKRALHPPYTVRDAQFLAPHIARRAAKPHDGNGSIKTTIDADLQRFAERAVRQHVSVLREQNLHDAAVMVLDNRLGEVLAYVGSSGPLSPARHVDGIQARRQAGSTLKPFIYGLALEQRYLTAASLIDDSAVEIPIAAGDVYRPRNYDERFHGPVSVRQALASSLNTPAVRALLKVRPTAAVRRLGVLGFGNLMDPDFYGPSLALGSADITLWELANAYRTIANGGVYSEARLTPSSGHAEGNRVMPDGVAFILTSILSDRGSRSLTFGLDSPLSTPYFTAVKTGTSKDMRDNWTVGFSSHYTVAVWAGNFSGRPMWRVSGVSGAGPIWRNIMDYLHKNTASHFPAPPAGVVQKRIVVPTTGAAYGEWFLEGTEPHNTTLIPSGAHQSAAMIHYPNDGTLFAVDPDIPGKLHRIVFRAKGDRRGLRWNLNGRDLGPALTPHDWAPHPGTYRLALVDEENRIVSVVEFTVR